MLHNYIYNTSVISGQRTISKVNQKQNEIKKSFTGKAGDLKHKKKGLSLERRNDLIIKQLEN